MGRLQRDIREEIKVNIRLGKRRRKTNVQGRLQGEIKEEMKVNGRLWKGMQND